MNLKDGKDTLSPEERFLYDAMQNKTIIDVDINGNVVKAIVTEFVKSLPLGETSVKFQIVK